MSENLDLVEIVDASVAEAGVNTAVDAETVALDAAPAPAPAPADDDTIVALTRRRLRKEGDEADARADEDAVPADAAAAEAGEQVPVAAGAAGAAGGQAAAASSIGGFLSSAGLALNPIVLAGVAAVGAVGVVAVASSGGDSGPPANRTPLATADTATATEDAAAITGSIATNDSDPDSDALTFALTTPVAGLTINANGSWSFDASNPAYQDLGVGKTRVVTANYTVSDGRGGTATSTLTITVSGANDGPVAVADALAVVEDAAVVAGTVAANDRDIDGDVLTYALAAPVAGLTFNGDGSYRFDPSHAAYQDLGAGETRDVVVRYSVSDGHGGVAEATLTIRVTGVADIPPNHDPVPGSDSFAATEDGAILTGSVASNDNDPDGDVLTYHLLAQAPGLVLNPDGSFAFDPAHAAYQSIPAGEIREVLVEYEVSDGRGGVAFGRLLIEVHGANDGPTTATVSVASAEDGAIIHGSLGAADPDGEVLTYVLPDPTPPGLTFDGHGGYAFDPTHAAYQGLAAGEVRTIVTTYSVVDFHSTIATAALTIVVTGTNDIPVAVADIAAATEDGAVVTGSVASNDADVDGDALGYALTAPVAGLTLNADGSYSFDASDPAYQDLNQGQTRAVVATYTVSDGHGGTATASLTITVAGRDERPNVAPVVVDDVLAAAEGDALITGSAAGNDTDADGDVLHYAVITGAPGLTLNGDGSYSFDPSHADYQGLGEGETRVVVASYVVTDGFGGSVNSTLTITVTGTNDAPVAAVDVDTALEDDIVVSGSVAANDRDADANATLAYAIAAPVAGLTFGADGRYVLDLTHPDYQALAAGTTLDLVIPYTVTDEHGATSTSTLTITITGMNDAPVANPEAWTATEDGALLVGNVSGNDGDIDQGDQLTYSLSAPVAGLTFGADGSYSFNPGHAAYQGLALGQTMNVTATYTVTDEQGAQATSVLIITVIGTNDAPIARADDLAVHEDAGVVSGSVAGNDVDPDAGRTLTYAVVTAVTGLTLNPDGSYTFNTNHPEYQAIPAGVIRYIGVTYTVTDEHGASSRSTLTLIVTGANDAPTAVADTAATTEDAAAITGSVAANDGDVDTGATLNYALAAPVAGLTLNSDGSWSFDPANPAYDDIANGQTRNVVAAYTVTDEHGTATTSTLTITVTGVNAAPTARGELAVATEDQFITGSLAGNDTDPDQGAVLTYNVPVVPGLSVNSSTGAFSFDAGNAAYDYLAAGQLHIISVDYTVSDGQGGSATARLVIQLTGTNDAPTAAFDTAAATEDGTAVTGSVATNDSDPDSAGALTYSLVTTAAGLTFNADGSYSFNPGDAAYQNIPAGQTRNVVVEYRVTDGTDSSTSWLTITVTGVNDAPVGTTDNYFVVEDGALTIPAASGVLANDRDPDGQPVTAHLVAGPAHGTLTLNPDGSFTYTPAGGYTGSDTFTYVARDAAGDSAPVTVNLTVAEVNDLAVSFATVGTEFGRVGGEQLVNTITVGDQDAPVVGGLAGGGFVVVWQDTSGQGGDASGSSIKAQRYNAAGQPVGGEFLVNTVTSGYQGDVSIAGLAAGGFVVTWSDQNNAQIKAQRFDATGAKVGGEFRVDNEGSSSEGEVTALAGGGFVVTWTDGSEVGEEGYGVRAQIYDAAGARVGGEIVVNTQQADDQYQSDVTAVPGGGFIVNWLDESAGRFMVQRFDASGAKVGGEIAIHSRPDVFVFQSNITGLPSGGFIASWTEFNEAFESFVHLQLFNASGQPMGPPVRSEAASPPAQANPSVTVLTDGGFVLVWNENGAANGDGSASCVKAQRFDASGAKVGAAFIVNSVAQGYQGAPQVEALADGGFAITWPDQSGVGDHSGAGVKVQVFGPLPPFAATEQESLDLKGKISIVDDAGAAEITVVLTVDHGVLGISAGSSGASVSGSGTNTVTIIGSRAQVNALLGGDATSTIHYTSTADHPPANALLGITIRDGATPIGTGAQILSIREVNDGPVLGADAVTVNEDGPLLTGSLATNDSDADGDTLTYTVTGPVGGFVLNANGGYSFDPAHPAWQNVPAGTTVDVPIDYEVSDGRGGVTPGTFTISITGSNDAPTAFAVSRTVDENGFDKIGNVPTSDVDSGAVLTHVLLDPVAGLTLDTGGSYRLNTNISPYKDLPAGQSLTVSARYRVTDEHGASTDSTITFTVRGRNDAPTVTFSTTPDAFAATEQLPLNLKGKIVTDDVDTGAVMTATLQVQYGVLTLDAGASGAVVTGNGTDRVVITGTAAQVRALLTADATSTVSYTAHTDDPPLSVIMTVTVNDGSLSSSRTQEIRVTDTPGFAPDGAQVETVREGEAGDRSDEDLIPVGGFEIGTADRVDFVHHDLDLTQMFSEGGEDDLGVLLAAVDFGGGEALPLAENTHDFAIPDGFVVLDPLDPLFLPVHAVV